MAHAFGSLKGCHRLARGKLGKAQRRPGSGRVDVGMNAESVPHDPAVVQRFQRCRSVLPMRSQGSTRLAACRRPADFALG